MGRSIALPSGGGWQTYVRKDSHVHVGFVAIARQWFVASFVSLREAVSSWRCCQNVARDPGGECSFTSAGSRCPSTMGMVVLSYRRCVAVCMEAISDFFEVLFTLMTVMGACWGGATTRTLDRHRRMSSVPSRVLDTWEWDKWEGSTRHIMGRGSKVFISVGLVIALLGYTPHIARVRRLRACF